MAAGAVAGIRSVVRQELVARQQGFENWQALKEGLQAMSDSTAQTTTRPVITAVAAGFFDINVLGDMTSVGTLAAFAIVCLSVIYLRRSAPDLPRGFKVPFYPALPILGILSCLMLMLSLPVGNWLRLVVWLAIGLVIYFSYGRYHSTLGKELKHGTAGAT